MFLKCLSFVKLFSIYLTCLLLQINLEVACSSLFEQSSNGLPICLWTVRKHA